MSIPLARLVALFCAILVMGITLTLPLYHFHVREFVHSKLFIKIVFWIPIFWIFVGYLYLSNVCRGTLITILALLALAEIIRTSPKHGHDTTLLIYYFVFAIALFHLSLISFIANVHVIEIMIALCFSSVLSDVTAFFAGNYLGRHKLPVVLNNEKSWEGVAGQIVGAVVGIVLVRNFIVDNISLWLFFPVGVGAAMGDLTNSYMKRLAGIKQWSNSIPGHGGFLDRLSSLAGSALLTYYFVILFSSLR